MCERTEILNSLYSKKCSDPFKTHETAAELRKGKKKKAIKADRFVKEEDLETPGLKRELTVGMTICTECQKKMKKMREQEEEQAAGTDSTQSQSSGEEIEPGPSSSAEVHFLPEQSLEVNKSLETFGESPINRQKMRTSGPYARQKAQKVSTSVTRTLQYMTPHRIATTAQKETNREKSDGDEVIEQLKIKFQQCSTKTEKYMVLTTAPNSWSVNKLKEQFGVTEYMAKQSKKLQKINGFMSAPEARTGRGIPDLVVEDVVSFFRSDEVSRQMPGKKDCVSVKEDGGGRVLKQKRLILSNLKEAYQCFKEKFPQHKIGFSKFADLRPKECVLAGSSGTHSVCVCTIHQNLKLMIVGSKLDKKSKGAEKELNTYSDCIEMVLCNPATQECNLGLCEKCESMESFKNKLMDFLIDEDEIEYKQWTTTDRSSLVTISESTEEFVDKFCNKLNQLRRHDFIAKQQSKFCSEKKDSLVDGEVLVICDFAENYSFVMQDAAQSFHWNNAQATLHPFVAYYKDGNELKHTSLVLISDCLIHDTTAVHLFQGHLIDHLEKHLGKMPSKIIYFSDGAASQYKNFKNFTNLCFHEEDFGCPAEWHFYATSHGKGPCDGIGGTVKRQAARASLQRPYNDQIITAKDLFQFTTQNVPSVSARFTTEHQHKMEEEKLEERFSMGKTIKGTQRLHAFYPISDLTLKCKEFSYSSTDRKVDIRDDKSQDVDVDEIKGFVTAAWHGKWYLALVLEVDNLLGDVKLSFLTPPGPAGSYSFPEFQDIGLVPSTSVLMCVDPVLSGASGRGYRITKKETDATKKRMKCQTQ